MTRPATVAPRARLDLLEQFVYFGEQASAELAERYLAAVERTCALIAKRPGVGALYRPGNREAIVRRAPVQGFANYLIFYRTNDLGIEVIRVLHGAQDLDNLFATE